jgi:hypothetical protein
LFPPIGNGRQNSRDQHGYSNFKRWALGTYHGFRAPHLRRDFEEFVVRWNRRGHKKSSFDRLLGIAAGLPHARHSQFVDQSV